MRRDATANAFSTRVLAAVGILQKRLELHPLRPPPMKLRLDKGRGGMQADGLLRLRDSIVLHPLSIPAHSSSSNHCSIENR